MLLRSESDEFKYIQSLLQDEEKLEDYLDYLHVQKVKQQSDKRLSLEQVQQACNLSPI
jgi:hypothetical protein